MKINKGTSSTSFRIGGIGAVVRHSAAKLLVDGGVQPASWTEWDYVSNGGAIPDYSETNDLGETALQYEPVARFLTPLMSDASDTTRLDVLVQPFCGVETDGTPNVVTSVGFSLNGGALVEGYKTTRASGTEVWSIDVPASLSFTTNEVRAVVTPRIGKKLILQGGAMDSTFTTRGVFLGQYTDYWISPSGSDSNDGLSSGAPKLTAQSAYAAAYAAGNLPRIQNGYDKSNTSNQEFFWSRNKFQYRSNMLPIVVGGHVFVNTPWYSGQPDYSEGCTFKQCTVRVDTSVVQSSYNSFKNSRTFASGGYFLNQWIDCDISYDSKADSNGGQFGEIEDHLAAASSPPYSNIPISFTLRTDNSLGVSAFYPKTIVVGCDVRYGTIDIAAEIIDSSVLCPSPFKNDVCNAELIESVIVQDVGPHLYPWGSIAAGQTTFGQPIDRELATVNNSDTFSQVTALYDGSNMTVDGSGVCTSIVSDPTYNEGFVEDFVKALAGQDTVSGWNTKQIDLRSNIYPGALVTAALDPHVDIQQLYGSTKSNVIVHSLNIDSPMAAQFQGIFWEQVNVNRSHVWDFVCDANPGSTVLQVGTANPTTGSENYWQHYGPNVTITTTSASIGNKTTTGSDCWVYNSGLTTNGVDMGSWGTIIDTTPTQAVNSCGSNGLWWQYNPGI